MQKRILENKKRIILIIVILFILITLLNSFRTIKSGEVGLKIRFGKIVESSMKEGLNFKIPYFESIEIVNIRVKKIEATVEGASKDLQDITAVGAINYHVESNKASNLYRTVGKYYEETIIAPAIQESIKSVLSGYTAEEIIIKRSEVSEKCKVKLQEKVDEYGITIDNLSIIDLRFSQEYSKAIEEKQVAEQNVQKAKQELEQTKIEAEKKIIAAEADRKANELLKKSLNKDILTQQFIEKWNGHLPKVMGGQNIFDITSLLGD